MLKISEAAKKRIQKIAEENKGQYLRISSRGFG